jgi:hypothetical protein
LYLQDFCSLATPADVCSRRLSPLVKLPRLHLVLVLAALALPGTADAGVRVVARDLPVAAPAASRAKAAAAERTLAPRTAPLRFNLVGLHWRGSGQVWFRTATAAGAWSAWSSAQPEEEDRPDARSLENRADPGWKLGNPYWTGSARRLQLRVRGDVTRVRAFYLWSPVTAVPAARTVAAGPVRPAIITRAAWGADEQIVRGTPGYASRLAFSVVHHTAGAAPTSKAQSAAMVRGIQSYHVRSNGWNDIGYNFLVDPFGQVFEGRRGGITKAVIGAHAMGFNTGSVGVAVLGTYESRGIGKAARAALVSLLAWKLDIAHVDPTSRLTWISAGNPKYPAGKPVSIRAVSGHRDTGPTACPGAVLYGTLGSIAADVRPLGGPKIFSPRATGSIGDPVRFTARLSASLPWSVTVLDGAGVTVASGSGTGLTVDWTWQSAGAPPGSYRYRIEAGPTVRAATGPIAGLPPLALTSLSTNRATVTPNGDGDRDSLAIRLGVTRPATLAVTLENASGATVATLFTARAVTTGTNTVTWSNGKAANGTTVPDGRYTLVARVASGVEASTREKAITVDRTLSRTAVAPSLFSPNGDGRRETVSIGFTLSRQAQARVGIYAGYRLVATAFAGTTAAGRKTVTWNGGAVADGRLRVIVSATTSLGTRKQELPLVLDTTRPVVKVLVARRERRGTFVRLQLSERANLAVRLGTQLIRLQGGPGEVELWRRVRATRVTVYSTDLAGNSGGPAYARVSYRR